tara:strand:- start:16 stop:564 length:549 start_codon:yes stop_codon:yes gene_type:complete
VSDTEGGLVKNVELENGKFSRRNKKGVRWGVKLKDAVNHLEQQKLWPTPTQDAATERTKKYAQGGKPLTMAVQEQEKQKLWPTPRVSSANGPSRKEIAAGNPKRRLETEVELYPTPVAHEARLGYQRRDTGKKGTQKSLTTIVIDAEGGRETTKAQLNPGWVTALMGFPRGWTAPGNTNSTG